MLPDASFFPLDREFPRLLLGQPDIDLPLVALEIARDAQPRLDFQHTFDWIEHRGNEIERRLRWVRTERMRLHEVARCLAGTHGLHGNREAFDSPESSYLNRVIATGTGIPISLSAIYMAVARCAGVSLHGVSAPMHFLCRYESDAGPVFIDAFNNGRLMNYSRCLDWMHDITDLSDDEIEPSLDPVQPIEIVTRMLNNLKALHIRQENWRLAWKVQSRLTALQPRSYISQRDLGLLALKVQRAGFALDLLNDCLAHCPGDERPFLERHIDLARGWLCRWN